MAKKNKEKRPREKTSFNPLRQLREETVQGIFVVVFFVLAAIFLLAAGGYAGIIGNNLYRLLNLLLGIGYFLLPLLFLFLAVVFFRNMERRFSGLKLIMALFLFLAGLGIIELSLHDGGIAGSLIALPLLRFFDIYLALLLLAAVIVIALLIILEARLTLAWLSFFRHAMFWKKRGASEDNEDDASLPYEEEPAPEAYDEEPEEEPARETGMMEKILGKNRKEKPEAETESGSIVIAPSLYGDYTPPPLSLVERDRGKPGVGDIKANANIIKRTLQNFGITVEMDEISIGPSVTRYALKPAEGVRLQKIVSLQNNLELALAAHPVRIEAPIPGKSLVGIEVPNITKMTVGLASLLSDEKFSTSNKQLLIALGRDIAGASHFGNLAKMPHMLIAGATGSGKSVSIHALITSLLYRNSPDVLRFIMIDPKRVELTLYNKIPHLLTPVVTDPKKAILALKWATKEMERRYNVLETESVRDVESYHTNVFLPALKKLERNDEEEASLPESMPYIVIIIDELADIMHTYPRELESAVVRLAQMSRAVGIHLVLSTQRPSVDVITGLIKANIPARIALQVASQIDSRTILDTSGAEKLLGAGDMLYLSGDMGKPLRLQSAFIGEDEVKRVVSFIAKNNQGEAPGDITAAAENGNGNVLFDALDENLGDEDDLYEDARAAVTDAGKASTSYLQRKLRIGYSRAARLMDILEERGVIGPADGSRPRDVIGHSGEEKTEEIT